MRQKLEKSGALESPDVALPTMISTAGQGAAKRHLEFFTAHICNPNTRRAYHRAARKFLHWCEHYGVARVVQD